MQIATITGAPGESAALVARRWLVDWNGGVKNERNWRTSQGHSWQAIEPSFRLELASELLGTDADPGDAENLASDGPRHPEWDAMVAVVNAVVGSGTLSGAAHDPTSMADSDAKRHVLPGLTKDGASFELWLLEWPDREWSVERWMIV